MKKDNRINPVGLKGNQINERMKELMGIKPINENHSTYVIELTKIGPDGNAYAIVRENHEYYIKMTTKKENLLAEDFKYIGGLQNKKSEAYPSYAKATKHLNLKFNSLAESFDAGHNINVLESDNLVKENGLKGGYSDMPKGGGFTGEGNLEGNSPLPMTEEEEITPGEEENEEDTLSEEEKAIMAMTEDESTDVPAEDAPETDAPETLTEHKLSIIRAMSTMDKIIDGLTEGTTKKKVYTIK